MPGRLFLRLLDRAKRPSRVPSLRDSEVVSGIVPGTAVPGFPLRPFAAGVPLPRSRSGRGHVAAGVPGLRLWTCRSCLGVGRVQGPSLLLRITSSVFESGSHHGLGARWLALGHWRLLGVGEYVRRYMAYGEEWRKGKCSPAERAACSKLVLVCSIRLRGRTALTFDA